MAVRAVRHKLITAWRSAPQVLDVGANFGYYTLLAATMGCRCGLWLVSLMRAGCSCGWNPGCSLRPAVFCILLLRQGWLRAGQEQEPAVGRQVT